MFFKTFRIPASRIVFVLVAFFSFAMPSASRSSPRVVHVFVALADNRHQGIVPVPPALGNGSDPRRNLYWGAAFGVKTFFKSSGDWQVIFCGRGPKAAILERCVFKAHDEDVFLVADAYQGSEIKPAVTDFLSAAAGISSENISVKVNSVDISVAAGGAADLLAYVGHDAFMDFQIPPIAGAKGSRPRRTIILACASKTFFGPYLRQTGAEPLLWTTGLMAPEAYTLKAAVAGWIASENDEAIRHRAAQAYDKYQKCGERAALKLFTTTW
jgi:hypothetical protein